METTSIKDSSNVFSKDVIMDMKPSKGNGESWRFKEKVVTKKRDVLSVIVTAVTAITLFISATTLLALFFSDNDGGHSATTHVSSSELKGRHNANRSADMNVLKEEVIDDLSLLKETGWKVLSTLKTTDADVEGKK